MVTKYLWMGATFICTACATAGVNSKATQERGAAPAATGGNATLVLSPEVSEGFTFLYRFIKETEFVLCLEGEARRGQIRIDAFRLARMSATRINGVSYHPCSSSRYIGTAHNHPPVISGMDMCYQSAADQRSFTEDGRAVVDIVLCGADKFLWAHKDGQSAVRRLYGAAMP